jgi:glycerol-3-phosphate O-acyltransferase
VQTLAADLHVPAVRFLGWLLSYVWARFYSSEVYIDVEGLQRVRQMAPEHILIYVPTHKSHLDYLLLSYILFNSAIPVRFGSTLNPNLAHASAVLERLGLVTGSRIGVRVVTL